LSLNLILSYWIGWISQTHGLSDAMNMILKAYSTGKMDFDDYKKAEDEKKAAAKEG
jgi:predicted nucleic-acid-binding protein